MTLTRLVSAVLFAGMLTAGPALAQDITVRDSYLRSSTPSSLTGAAFMTLTNGTDSDDRLIGVTSPVAERVELHAHTEDANGVMRMGEIEGGVPLAVGESHTFGRGGDHLMFIGLTAPLEQGTEVPVTLTFEKAGDVQVMVPVDQERKPDHGAMKMKH